MRRRLRAAVRDLSREFVRALEEAVAADLARRRPASSRALTAPRAALGRFESRFGASCLVPDCLGPRLAKGYCRRHYQATLRLQRRPAAARAAGKVRGTAGHERGPATRNHGP